MDFEPMPNLHLGTSSWSAESWVEPFYPPGTPPADFLPIYASHYNTVEIDSTYYRIPSRRMVQGWFARTPPGFTFAAKFPAEITPKKLLVDCEPETTEFLSVMELLGEKLGPLLLQFPYLNQEIIPGPDEFLSRLARHLECLPFTHRHAVEGRNKNWLRKPATIPSGKSWQSTSSRSSPYSRLNPKSSQHRLQNVNGFCAVLQRRSMIKYYL